METRFRICEAREASKVHDAKAQRRVSGQCSGETGDRALAQAVYTFEKYAIAREILVPPTIWTVAKIKAPGQYRLLTEEFIS